MRCHTHRSLILAAAAAALGLPALSLGQTAYDITVVDAFTPTYNLRETYLFDISDAGIGCGATNIAVQSGGNTSIVYTGFVWSTDTGKTAIPLAWPKGINNSGLVVGTYSTYDINTGTTVTPPLLPGTFLGPVFLGVNDEGTAVGYIQTCNCSNSQGLLQIPYVWDGAAARSLAVPGATGAERINTAGQVVGWIGGVARRDAYVYDLVTDTYTLISQLFPAPPPGYHPRTTATDISDVGVVVGSRASDDGLSTRGYTWTVGAPALELLPTPPAGFENTVRPSGINTAGVVVGSIYTSAGSPRAFVYDPTGGIRDLNTLTTPPAGFVLMGAYKVNDSGWIVGYGAGGGGMYKSFVLKPRPPACPADWTGDGQLTPADVAAFVSAWLASVQQGTLVGDFDGSGAVEPVDLAVFVGAWFAAVAAGGC